MKAAFYTSMSMLLHSFTFPNGNSKNSTYVSGEFNCNAIATRKNRPSMFPVEGGELLVMLCCKESGMD